LSFRALDARSGPGERVATMPRSSGLCRFWAADAGVGFGVGFAVPARRPS
jgi:hypothetical protein